MKTASIILIVSLLTLNQACAQEVAYPQGYRNWTHVKSMLIQPDHPLANPFQGIHHIYANSNALLGLKTGTFTDGSVLVFDLLHYQEVGKAISEGQRKLLGVMVKDNKRFAKTGGWGFEGFAGNSQSKRLTTDGGQACFACHTQKRQQGFVFSQHRP